MAATDGSPRRLTSGTHADRHRGSAAVSDLAAPSLLSATVMTVRDGDGDRVRDANALTSHGDDDDNHDEAERWRGMSASTIRDGGGGFGPAIKDGPATVDVMAIIQRYPALAAIWHHFVGCTFVESDGFVEKSRKITVTFGFCGVLISAVLPYYVYLAVVFTSQCAAPSAGTAVTAAPNATTVAANVNAASSMDAGGSALACARKVSMWLIVCIYVVFTFVLGWSFVYMRRHRQCPDWLMLATWTTIIVCGGLWQISLPFFPIIEGAVAVAVGLMLTRPPGQSLVFGLGLVPIAVKIANDVFNNAASLPGSYDLSVRTWPDALFVRLAGVVLLALSFAACIVLVHEAHSRQLQAARAAELALSVANRLVQYDTDGCRDVIARYRARTGAADEPLIAAMTGLVANLERYRPFLPNYVLDAGSADDDDDDANVPVSKMTPRDEDEDDVESNSDDVDDDEKNDNYGPARASVHSTQPTTAAPMSPTWTAQQQRPPPPGGHAPADSTPQPRKSVDSARHASPVRSSVSTISTTERELDGVRKMTTATAHSSLGDPAPLTANDGLPRQDLREPPPRAAAPSMAPAPEGWSRAAVCFGRLVVQPLAFADASVASSAAQHRFVNDLHAISQTTGAALHAFVGDTLTLTWNATRRVAQAETRACRFMLGVRDWIARDRVHAQHFACWGAVTSANAKCLFAGGDRLRLFYCAQQGDTGETEAKASAMLSTARALHSVVVDRRTWDGARFQIAAIPVDLVATLQATGGVAPEPIFEILKDESGDLRASHSKGDEWMYELQRTEEFEKDVSAWMSSLCDGQPAVFDSSSAARRHATHYASLAELLQRPSVERYAASSLPKRALDDNNHAAVGGQSCNITSSQRFLQSRVQRLAL